MLKTHNHELFITTRTSIQDPSIRPQGGNRSNTFFIIEQGAYEGEEGFWVEDEEGLEGFMSNNDEETFWVLEEILLRILHISLVIPCRQRHAVYHRTVQWIHHCRHMTNLAEEMQRLNSKNSPFHPQADSIDWGVMSLCRHSRNHLSQFFRLSWYLHHLRFLRIPKQKTKMKILNCQHLCKKKQLAVHQRSRRLGRRR